MVLAVVKMALVGFAAALMSSVPTIAAGSDDVTALRALMAKRGDRASEIVRQTFPVEYEAAEKQAAHQYAITHDENAALASLAAFATQLRSKYFYQIANAPDEDLEAIADAKLAQYRVLKRLDPIACVEMGETGVIDPQRALNIMHMHRDPGADTGTPQFLALKHARENPVTRTALTDNDSAAIVQEYVRRGGSIEYLQSQGRKTGPPLLSADDRCQNIILLNEAAKAVPREAASRFWASAYLSVEKSP